MASDQVSAPVRMSQSQNPVPDVARTSSRRSSRRSSVSARDAIYSERDVASRSRWARTEAINQDTTMPPTRNRTVRPRSIPLIWNVQDGARKIRALSTPVTSVAVAPPRKPATHAARAAAAVSAMYPLGPPRSASKTALARIAGEADQCSDEDVGHRARSRPAAPTEPTPRPDRSAVRAVPVRTPGSSPCMSDPVLAWFGWKPPGDGYCASSSVTRCCNSGTTTEPTAASDHRVPSIEARPIAASNS